MNDNKQHVAAIEELENAALGMTATGNFARCIDAKTALKALFRGQAARIEELEKQLGIPKEPRVFTKPLVIPYIYEGNKPM